MVNRIMYLAIACLTFIMITAPISPSTNPRQNCSAGQSKACAESNGWRTVIDWPINDFDYYIDALRKADQGGQYSDEPETCDDIQQSGIDVLERSRALANGDELRGTPVYFYRGDQETLGEDDGAAFFRHAVWT